MTLKRRMSFKDALDLVDDDLPDGAYWAMAHEIAGLEYGEGFDELMEADDKKETLADVHCRKPHVCKKCNRRFASIPAMKQHGRDRHGDTQ